MVTRSGAWLFDSHGPPADVLTWHEQELPEPGPGQALVKIRAIGVNRSDLNYVLGSHFPARRFPSHLGGEAIGEIVALGPKLDADPPRVGRLQLEVGARVGTLSGRVDRISMGVFREYGLYDQAALAPVPDDLSDTEAAGFWTAVFTMAGAMDMAGFNADSATGKRVLITAGTSGMGTLGLKLARHWGAITIGTTRNEGKADDLAALADQVIVCDDGDSLIRGMQSADVEQSADLILDPVGAAFYPALLKAVASGGHIVSYECITGGQASLSVMVMMMKDISIHGYTTFRAFNDPQLLDRLIDVGLDNVQALRPVISDRFELTNAPQALENLGHSAHFGKLVIEV